VKANFPTLGPRLGPKMKVVASGISKLSRQDLESLEAGKTLNIEGEHITLSDIEIRRSAKAGIENLMAHQLVSIILDPSVTPEQLKEGLAREVIRRIQMARKNAKLNLDDRIELQIKCSGDLKSAVEAHQ